MELTAQNLEITNNNLEMLRQTIDQINNNFAQTKGEKEESENLYREEGEE